MEESSCGILLEHISCNVALVTEKRQYYVGVNFHILDYFFK
jgi:hypothetical protein